MDYSAILSKDKLNILITGDSLSYNRYGYYDTPKENAYNCSPGMPSWSFSLRDRLYFNDEQFVYANALSFPCRSASGIDCKVADKYAELFRGKIKTLLPDTDVSFSVPVSGNQVVLYLQKRLDNYCTFDIEIDGVIKAANVSNLGDAERFNGFEPMIFCFECDYNNSHTVAFRNIRGSDPKITVCAAGKKYKNVILNGKGNQCVSFFTDNFEERIASASPDLIIMTLSANDRARISTEQYENDIKRLFGDILARFPECKTLFLIPPSSRDQNDPQNNCSPYTSDDVSNKFNNITCKICNGFNIDLLDTSSLFDGLSIYSWRFDNIHLNQNGNEILLEAICQRLGI